MLILYLYRVYALQKLILIKEALACNHSYVNTCIYCFYLYYYYYLLIMIANYLIKLLNIDLKTV